MSKSSSVNARPGGNQRPPIPKTNYESNADVQRWLREQPLDTQVKPPFDPTFLAGQHDRPWVLSALTHFYERDLIDDVVQVARSGKEATVYCCTGGSAADAPLLAAKVYRPRMFRSLRNDAVYRESRAQRDERGRPLRDRRRKRGTGSERGRAEQVASWIDYEYATQRRLHDAGADDRLGEILVGGADQHLLHRGIPRGRPRACRQRVVRLELHHRPEDEARSRQGLLEQRELREEVGLDALPCLVARPQGVPEGLDHLVRRHRDVRRAAVDQAEQRGEHPPDRTDLGPVRQLRGRQRVVVAEQFIGPVDQVDVHAPYNGALSRIQPPLFRAADHDSSR